MNAHVSKFGYATREEADEITRLARGKWAAPMIRVESYDGRDVQRVQGSKAAADVWADFLQRHRSPPIAKFASESFDPMEVVKLALATSPFSSDTSPEQRQALQQKFDTFSNWLENKGVYAGTGHKRIIIPKNKISEPDLGTLGFEPVVAAIPEAGQDRFQSFRHPNNNYHLHSHGDNWTMHRDEHPAATMLMRTQGLGKAIVKGVPHVITEGLPGMAYYLGGKLRGRKSTADVVKSELSPDYANLLSQIPDSTPKAASITPAVQGAAPVGVSTRLKKRQRGWHYEKEPGFHDVKGKFQDAARINSETKVAATAEALRTYGIDPKHAGEITDAPDPLKALTQVLRTKDFGFGGQKDRGRNFGEFASWGPPTGMSGGDAGSRVDGGSLMSGMSYGGV